MAGAKTTRESPVLPRMVFVKPRIMGLMTYPPTIRSIHMRGVRVPGLVANVSALLLRARGRLLPMRSALRPFPACRRLWSTRRNVAVSHPLLATTFSAALVTMLVTTLFAVLTGVLIAMLAES